MSITDVLSADDIAAALQECQGKVETRQGWVSLTYLYLPKSYKN